jgi:hypothetical protein
MAGTNLEIKVFDKVVIADSLKKAIMVILNAFKKWIVKDEKRPFNLQVRKLDNKAPPALNISVQEEVITKTTLA